MQEAQDSSKPDLLENISAKLNLGQLNLVEQLNAQ
jgi:hypothetical protein